MVQKLFQSFSMPAFQFVFIMGIVNLFADITYEGGAALNGSFLGMLGGSALAISIIAGAGEFLGYSLRFVAGYLADKTKKYWLITFVGYTINLLAVPAMALAGSWEIAGILIIAERIGRAFRKPTVESMLSYTTGTLGRGWVYGVNTALDETGATLGPLIVALILFWQGNYKVAYAFLLISSVLAITALSIAHRTFPNPSRFEEALGASKSPQKFSPSYWFYMLAGALFACGLISYELIAYHLTSQKILAPYWVPVFLAFATLCGVFANLILGKTYDRFNLPVVLIAVVLSACFAPLFFLGNLILIFLAMPLLGIGYAIQDTLLKAIVADLLPKDKRSLAFGLFYTGYGCGWLIGSTISGFLYGYSLLALSLVAVLFQLSSLPVFLLAAHKKQ